MHLRRILVVVGACVDHGIPLPRRADEDIDREARHRRDAQLELALQLARRARRVREHDIATLDVGAHLLTARFTDDPHQVSHLHAPSRTDVDGTKQCDEDGHDPFRTTRQASGSVCAALAGLGTCSSPFARSVAHGATRRAHAAAGSAGLPRYPGMPRARALRGAAGSGQRSRS